MKKVLVVALCLIMAACMFAACSSDTTATDTTAESSAPAESASTDTSADTASESSASADTAADDTADTATEVEVTDTELSSAPAEGIVNQPQMSEQEAKDAEWYASIATAKNPFFAAMKLGYEDGAAQYGLTNIKYEDGQDDIATQIADYTDIMSSGAAILLANPVEGEAATPFAEAAFDAGFPVIYCDRGPSTDKYLCFLQSDNVELGRMSGNYIVDFLNETNGSPSGVVIEVQGRSGATPTIMRGQGFHEVIDQYPDVEVLQVLGEFDQQKALDVVTNTLQAHDDVIAIMNHNDDNALGAYKALQQNASYGGALVGEDGHVLITGIDGTYETLMAIKDGKIDVTMAQNPMTMGTEAVRLGLEFLQGNSIPKDIYWEIEAIEADTAESPTNWAIAANSAS